MTNEIISRAADGYYHPGSEAEVVALVKHAVDHKLQIRARGATHSVAWSIFTDPVDGKPDNRTLERDPPGGANIDLALDKLDALTWIDEDKGIVEAGAGMHLGKDPSDPFGASTLDNSLLHQIFQKGWAVDIVGGITHQTISGFTGTGSAGGSILYAFDNVIAFRVVDGLGEAGWIEKGDPEFDAMLTAVGLLGIVTAMRLQLVPMYNVAGQEITTPVTAAECPVDLFGPGDAGKPSFQRFLADTPYSRVTWWPQQGCERLQIWQASRVPGTGPEGDLLIPYQQFTPNLFGQTKQLIASVFFVLLGNRNVGRIFAILRKNMRQFRNNLAGLWKQAPLGPAAPIAAYLVSLLLSAVLFLPVLILSILPNSMRGLFSTILPIFNPMTGTGQPTRFNDYYWRSLCMDNTADDVLLGTEFCEIWLPIQYTQQVMTLLKAMFAAKRGDATGYFAQEIYAAAPSSAWINPSYSDGADEYKDGVSRFDIYWYRDNEGAPNVQHAFFQQYWDLLLANDIPFRFHWGKFIPFYDFPFWANHYRTSLPRLGDFLDLRARRDPHNIFFTNYWQLRLTGAAI